MIKWVSQKKLNLDNINEKILECFITNHFTNNGKNVIETQLKIKDIFKVDSDKEVLLVCNGAMGLNALVGCYNMLYNKKLRWAVQSFTFPCCVQGNLENSIIFDLDSNMGPDINKLTEELDNYDGVIDHKYLFTNIGYNLKPLDLQGAIGLAQIEKVDRIDVLRRQYKDTLDTFLEKKDGLRTIKASPGSSPSWFGTPVYCESPELKEFFVSHLEANHIQTRNYFSGNVLMHPGYRHLDDFNNYPNSNLALSNVFFLGCSPLWTDKVVEYIGKVIEEF